MEIYVKGKIFKNALGQIPFEMHRTEEEADCERVSLHHSTQKLTRAKHTHRYVNRGETDFTANVYNKANAMVAIN
jgi:hypothetical protein